MGLGMKIPFGAEGTYVALTAGTGIVPFMDLFFYLLRRSIYRSGMQRNIVNLIFKNEFD